MADKDRLVRAVGAEAGALGLMMALVFCGILIGTEVDGFTAKLLWGISAALLFIGVGSVSTPDGYRRRGLWEVWEAQLKRSREKAASVKREETSPREGPTDPRH